MKVFLAAMAGLLLGLTVGFWLGGNLPKENYQQAFEANLTQAKLFLITLEKLDSGDVAKGRSLGIIPVFEDLDSLRYYTAKGWASPTDKQKQEWTAVARQTLDYMLRHKEEWDPRLLSTRDGVKGLCAVLSEPQDVLRLSELTNYLASAEQKMQTSH